MNSYRGGKTVGRPRAGRRGGANSFSRRGPKGLFKDNVWYCNCGPNRFPAEHFKVKKEGKNKGRWFYTCQKSEPDRCDFFLWDEDAEPRMEAAVFENSEAQGTIRTGDQVGWNAGRGHGDTEAVPGRGLFASGRSRGVEDEETDSDGSRGPPSYEAATSMGSTGAKRSADDAGFAQNGTDDSFSLSNMDEEEFVRAADNAPTTPYKAQKTGVYATPATSVARKLPWTEQPQTPGTHLRKTVHFDETPSKGARTTAEDQPETPAIVASAFRSATSVGPKTRFRDALDDPRDSHSSLTNEALDALSEVNIPAENLNKLRGILTKHDLRTQGITKGRDISRSALKMKDAKIAELQAKIASLEAEQEFQRQMRTLYGKSADDEALSSQSQTSETQSTLR